MADLPPTQYLALEVLAARHRAGERLWTFPSTVRPALAALEELGLITTMHGIAPASIRASLTAAGEAECLSPAYNVPVPTLAQAMETLPTRSDEVMAWLKEHGLTISSGPWNVMSAVRSDLRRMASETHPGGAA